MDESKFAELLANLHERIQNDGVGSDRSLDTGGLSPEVRAEFRAAQRWLHLLDDAAAPGRAGRPRSSQHGPNQHGPGQHLPGSGTTVGWHPRDKALGLLLSDSHRFRIRKILGSGGMGRVYEAYDRARRERVALKTVLRPTPDSILRLKNEFRAVAEIRHPNLVSLHELHRDGDQWFFSMELVHGQPFTDYFADLASELDLASALLQLLDGLSALHRGGWLHRDIKPSNVLITSAGRLVILDFGLRVPVHVGRSGSNRAAGTWSYMSPEQAAALPLAPSSDLYSVGVMLYEALTGTLPFPGDSLRGGCARQSCDPVPPHQLRPEVSRNLERLCLALLRRSPRDRPTAQGIQNRLRKGSAPHASRRTDSEPSQPTFVGRRQELRSLNRALQSVQRGYAARVFLHGSSGIGKTSLAHEFLRQAWKPGVVVVQGRCYQNESVPYKAWDELMDALIEHLHHQEATAAVASIAESDWHALVRLFPGLQQLRMPVKEQPPETAEPAVVRRRAARTLRELLARAAEFSTLILCMDDLHWADTDSALLLTEVLLGEPAPRLMFVGTYRTEEEETSPFLKLLWQEQSESVGWRAASESIGLGPLPRTEAQKLIRRLLRHETRTALSRSAQILAESECHPLFIVTMTQGLQEGVPRLNMSQAVRLEEVLKTRVLMLSPPARALLYAVCLATQPLAEPLARRCAGIRRDRDMAYGELYRSRLIRQTWIDGRKHLAPYHDRIREIGSRQVDPAEAKQLHGRLARGLERDPATDLRTIAHHYHAAGQSQRARRYFERAGDRAAAAWAFDLAAECFGQAAELDAPAVRQRQRLFEKRADSLANAGKGVDAAHAYLQAASFARNDRVARRLHRSAAYQFCVSGHIAQGKDIFTKVLRTMGMRFYRSRWPIALLWSLDTLRLAHSRLPMAPPPVTPPPSSLLEKIDTTWQVALGMTMIDTLQGGLFQSRNLLLAIKAGEPTRLARACAWQATHLSTGGTRRKPQVDRLLSAAVQLSAGLSNPYLQGLITLSIGICGYFFGQWDTASSHCLQAAQAFRSRCRGVAWEIHTAHAFLLWSMFFQGRVRDMSDRLPELLEDARARGDRLSQASLSNFGGPLAWLSQDRPDQALAAMRYAMEMWPTHEFHVQHFTCLAGMVQIFLYQGRAAEAWEHLNAHWPALRRSFYLRIEAIRIFMLHLRARTALAHALGHPNSKLLRQAQSDATQLLKEHEEWAHGFGHLVFAGLASLQHNAGETISHFGQASAILRQHQLHLFAQSAERAIAVETGCWEELTASDIDRSLQTDGVVDPRSLCRLHAPYRSSHDP